MFFFFHLKDECEEGDTRALASGGKAISGPDNPTLSNTNTNTSQNKIQKQIRIQILASGGKAISGADNPTLSLNNNFVEPKIQIQVKIQIQIRIQIQI